MKGKAQGKLAGKIPTKIPQKHGGALFSGGVPGHDGSNAGRKPDEFKEWLAGQMDKEANRKVFEAFLSSGNMKAWEFAAKYSKELPETTVKATTELILRAVRE